MLLQSPAALPILHSTAATSTAATCTGATCTGATSTGATSTGAPGRPAGLAALLIPALALVLLLAAAGCSPAPPEAGDGLPSVVTTTGMIGDMAARIAGERAAVVALMQSGVDPHLFKPSESDVRRLAGADLILYNGLHLEGKMGDILEKMSRDRPVLAVASGVDTGELLEPVGYATQYDPHIWFDVSLWAQTLAPIAEALAELDPEHAGDYRAAGAELEAELTELDRWVAERIASLPPERRVLVTAHDAFGYFGRRYGVEVVGIQGISTVAEAGLSDVQRVVDLIVERRVPAIFIESSVPRRTVEAVQAACRSRGHQVAIGGELFSDAMGPAGTPEGSYVGMVRHNVETMVAALAGEER